MVTQKDVIEAVKEWRDARASFLFFSTGEIPISAWVRLGKAENHLMEIARELK